MMVPRYYQTMAKNAIFEYFESGKDGNPLVCMPTGTGKSIVIADFITEVFRMYSNQRIMMLTHVWKLIVQNANKLREFWPAAPLGIYSAGLDEKDTLMPITFGGVQSVVNAVREFGHIDLLLIDEAHLLNDEETTQYAQVISALKAVNPWLKIIGFTATPFRMKQGMLTDGELFTDICINFCTRDWILRFIEEGFMAPLIGKPTATRIEGLDKLKKVGGDFNQKDAERLVDKDEVVWSACQEILEFGHDRNKCMVFAGGIKNAEHIANTLDAMGASVTFVHSKLGKKEIARRLEAYSNGEYWGMVGANMLTTGYDEPSIDLIADLQATCSSGKHVQKLGRGTRVFNGKNNCLYLDFVGNVIENGPLDDPRLPRKPGEPTGELPIKICETHKLIHPEGHTIRGCGAYNHPSVRYCCNCSAEFSFASKVEGTAYNTSPMSIETNPVYDVVTLKQPVFYVKSQGKMAGSFQKPPYIRATYTVGMRPINVILCFEHGGIAAKKARDWWRRHSPNDPPATCDEFLSRVNELRTPKTITVQSNLKYPEVTNYEF